MNRVEMHPVLEVPSGRPRACFHFDGKPMVGVDGEMVSSALVANGIRTFSIHRRGSSPQGIFCANGQCSQCTVVIDGHPRKSCVTALRDGMDIRTLRHLPHLPPDDRSFGGSRVETRTCQVLVIGGGPSGLTASLELARLGISVLLVDDKDHLGGKLLLQTHKFFGSIEDCHAGTRGIDIARILENELRTRTKVQVLTNASVVGIFKDRKAGVLINGDSYLLVDFQGLILASGARERSLIFPGNDLPGVYGAGAFQTLLNRDLVAPAKRVFIVGSGNVGLIAAYHALQAGICVSGIADILPEPSGYKVHASKIKRMGVPIYLGHTILCAEGEGRVERISIAQVDSDFNPLLDTAKTFLVDTLLVAVGLTPADEFHDTASDFGFPVVKAGDAAEIAEASSAMFGGRMAALQVARRLGLSVAEEPSFHEKMEVLSARPGPLHKLPAPVIGDDFQPVIHCDQEIPCDPCTSVCPVHAIELEGSNRNILDLPRYLGGCTGCAMCIAVCPGLAITLVRRLDRQKALVVLAHEYIPTFAPGDAVPLVNREGALLQHGTVQKIRRNKKYGTWLIHVQVPLEDAGAIAGIRIQDPSLVAPTPRAIPDFIPENGILCRCERITVGEVLEHIRKFQVEDANDLKQIRVGMGACGGKTCSVLLPRVFAMAGVDWSRVTRGTLRPLSVEVPMKAIANEDQRP